MANGAKISAEIDITRSVFLKVPICSIKRSAKPRILFLHAAGGSILLDISWKELQVFLVYNPASSKNERHKNPYFIILKLII